MKQAIHILRKDVRRLWCPLLIAFAVQVLFTFFEMQPHRQPYIAAGQFSADTLVDLLLLLAWWYLITALVHEESLPGDRQFWVTRPYSWKSLIAAKALFILVFVNLPVLVADCCILLAQGFSVAGDWRGLMWRQIPFTVSVLLPPMALGALTRNLGQVIIAILLVVLRIVVNSIPFQDSFPSGSTAMGWIEATVNTIQLLAVLAAIVLIQYRSRRTWLARALAAGFVVLPGFSIPLRWQLDWQARVKPPGIDGARIRIAFDPARGLRKPPASVRGATLVYVALPVVVNGAPDGVDLVSGQAKLTVGDHGRTAWSSDGEGATLERDQKGYWETIVIPANVFTSLRGKPVAIRMTAVVTAVRNSNFHMPLEAGPAQIPDVGICESWRLEVQFLNVNCRSAFRAPPRTRIHADYPGWDTPDPNGRPREQFTGDLSDSPFPAGLSLSPVHTAQVFLLAGNDLAAATNHPGAQLIFETEHPIAHFQTEIEFRAVRVDEYAVVVPED